MSGACETHADERPPRAMPRAALAALIAFPLVVWLAVGFGLGGELGKTTDDYSTNLRDPVTGGLPGGFRPFREYPYFWRPCHMVLIHAVQTFLFEHDRAIHAMSALVHGAAALLLAWLVRLMGGGRAAAATAAVILLAHPIGHENVYFTSAISAAIAACLYLWLATWVVRLARSGGSLSGGAVARRVAAMAAISLAIPFFYEQPGAAIPALFLAWWAGRPARAGGRAHAIRGVAVIGVLTLVQVVVAAALVASAPGDRRGSATSLTGAGELVPRMRSIASETVDRLVGSAAADLIAGGATLVQREMEGSLIWVWLIPLGLCSAAWVLAGVRGGSSPASSTEPARGEPASGGATPQPPGSARQGLMIALGAAAGCGSLLPVVLVSGQGLADRMLYLPVIGLGLATAGLGGLIGGRMATGLRRWAVPIGHAVVAVAAVAGAVAMLGMQSAYRARSRADVAAAEGIALVLRSAPANTVIVPMRWQHAAVTTGHPRFDRLRPGAFETIWSATAIARQAMDRRDVWATALPAWRRAAEVFPSCSTRGLVVADSYRIWSPFEEREADAGGSRVTEFPWEQVAPVAVDGEGRVRLVRRVICETPDGIERVVEPPMVKHMLDTGVISRNQTAPVRLAQAGAPGMPRLTPAPEWRFEIDQSVAGARVVHAWGRSESAVWMNPVADGGRRGSLTCVLPATIQPRRVVVRATIAPHDLDRRAASEAAEVILETRGADGWRIHDRRVIRRAAIRAEAAWLPLSALLGPSELPVVLRVRIAGAAGAEGDGVSDAVWITRAWVREGAEE